MSLEHQLHFDISRCSYCPLGAKRNFCSPVIHSKSEIVLLLEAPSLSACEENNGWRHPSANFLSKAIAHASGTDLSRFHLSFLLKCHVQVDGGQPPLKDKRAWASECSSHFLEWELRGLMPKKILIFGEFPARVCFPNHEASWEELQGNHSLTLSPFGLDAHIFENPRAIMGKGGLSSDEGKFYIEKLHKFLGGNLSLPDQKQQSELFQFLDH